MSLNGEGKHDAHILKNVKVGAPLTPKQFQKYADRDQGCVHCGTTEAIVPHHRANRGMGGSKARDVPSNIVAMCSTFNGLMESSAAHAQTAREYGWKLSTHDDPESKPIWYAIHQKWFMLDNMYGFREVEQ